jgi:hypothetical protein
MPVSAPASIGSGTSASEKSAALNNSFRDADFMQILLSEITHQDPFKPQDSQQIVEGMQKLQELANSRFEKTRDDQRWARDLVGSSVTVQQAQLQEGEVQSLRERGINPAVGFLTDSGRVESFRIIGETVWLRIDSQDYRIDNVRQIDPPRTDGSALTGMANVLGRRVRWDAAGESPSGSGVVTSMSIGDDGQVMLDIGNNRIPLSRVKGISVS